MTTITITHTPADGTLLEGTVKGDGALDALRAAGYRCKGWRYFPSIRAIGISHSRDHAPKLYLIDAAADVLRAAGFEVAVEIDGAPRAMEAAEADRADRMEDRAAALAGKAERKTAESDARFTTADQLAELRPFGQPILVGHHSEKAHRRDLQRVQDNTRKGIDAMHEAEQAAHHAATAERHMEARTNPRRVYRRIRTLTADLNRIQRGLDGHRRRHLGYDGQPVYVFDTPPAEGRYREQLELDKAHAEEAIRYWTEALDAAGKAGADVPPDTDAIQKGYWIKSWAGWNEVTRVNKVTVTVLDSYGEGRPTFPRKITLDDIREIRERSPFESA